ncbi:MAG: hypothetical protein N4A43_01505 [Alphaproteobacteria bacterium]|jgi:hypothetical protein|nr:hypothetical protein [Alphaproteobacteria bacterium]
MKNLIKWVAVASNAFLLIACSPPLPDTNLDDMNSFEQKQHFKWAERKPLRKVKLAGDFFISKQLDSNLPKSKAKQPISIKFSGRIGTVGDIVFMLEQKGFPVSYNWTVYDEGESSLGGSSSDISDSDSDSDIDFEEDFSSSASSNGNALNAITQLEKRVVPFKTYKGTIGGLLKRLRSAMNISYWYEDGTIFLSTKQEYVVSVPQQKDIIDSISSEITALGATDVSTSLTAGQIVYYAKPRSQQNLIKPFLQRISHNLSEITLQVALVQVEVKGNKSTGFDWDAFKLELKDPTDSSKNSNAVTIQPYNGDSDNPTGNISGKFFRKGISIFGTETDVSVDMAINILSTLGRTTTEQNVEMRTISGKEVKLESVKEEAYVSGYDGGSYGDNPEPPSPEFDTVETGLTLTFLPVFDAYNAIVTIDANFELSNRLADTTVNAGGDFKEITVKPNIKKDNLQDVVRIPVGETVILGGLMSEISNDNRTTPMGAWSLNSAKISSNKQALFLIIRPLVTLYETEGNEMSLDEEKVVKNVKYNYDKAQEKKKEDEKKALEEAEKKKAKEIKQAKEKVNRKALELEQKRREKEKQKAEMEKKLEQIKKEMEKKHQAMLEKTSQENSRLKAELEEQKKVRAVLEAEEEWKKEEVVETVSEEAFEEELKKIKMLNMLRGIKN